MRPLPFPPAHLAELQQRVNVVGMGAQDMGDGLWIHGANSAEERELHRLVEPREGRELRAADVVLRGNGAGQGPASC